MERLSLFDGSDEERDAEPVCTLDTSADARAFLTATSHINPDHPTDGQENSSSEKPDLSGRSKKVRCGIGEDRENVSLRSWQRVRRAD